MKNKVKHTVAKATECPVILCETHNIMNIMPREELKLGTGMRDKGKDSMLDCIAETFGAKRIGDVLDFSECTDPEIEKFFQEQEAKQKALDAEQNERE